MQRVRSGGQRLVQDAVAADAVEVDTVALQMKLEIALGTLYYDGDRTALWELNARIDRIDRPPQRSDVQVS